MACREWPGIAIMKVNACARTGTCACEHVCVSACVHACPGRVKYALCVRERTCAWMCACVRACATMPPSGAGVWRDIRPGNCHVRALAAHSPAEGYCKLCSNTGTFCVPPLAAQSLCPGSRREEAGAPSRVLRLWCRLPRGLSPGWAPRGRCTPFSGAGSCARARTPRRLRGSQGTSAPAETWRGRPDGLQPKPLARGHRQLALWLPGPRIPVRAPAAAHPPLRCRWRHLCTPVAGGRGRAE